MSRQDARAKMEVEMWLWNGSDKLVMGSTFRPEKAVIGRLSVCMPEDQKG